VTRYGRCSAPDEPVVLGENGYATEYPKYWTRTSPVRPDRIASTGLAASTIAAPPVAELVCRPPVWTASVDPGMPSDGLVSETEYKVGTQRLSNSVTTGRNRGLEARDSATRSGNSRRRALRKGADMCDSHRPERNGLALTRPSTRAIVTV